MRQEDQRDARHALDGRTLELTKAGRSISLRPQPLKLLALLLARAGELISRDELQRALWAGDTFVDFEQGLNHAIRDLRAALGDLAESPRFVQTLPRRGYRFIAPVERIAIGDGVLARPPTLAASPSTSIPTAASLPRRQPILIAALVLAVVIAAVALLNIGSRSGDTRLDAGTPSLVVRPFASPADPALGIGLANAITIRLGGQQMLAVRSARVEDSPVNRSSSHGELWPQGATHALEGEIAVRGTQVNVVARLQDASGATVWSDNIQARSDEIFSLEDVIAERVVQALRLRLAAAEQDRLRRRYTSNAAAYADYLRGRAALVRYTPEGTRSAAQAFEGALKSDPKYALARAGLAMAAADMYLRFAPASEVEQWGVRAEGEARTALDLDPDLAEAHLARAAVARKREFDWNETVAAGRRALALNPNLDQARFFIAGAFYHNGFMQEALIEMKKGRSLDGADVIEPLRIEALVALFSGNFAPARGRLEEVSRLSSQSIGDTYLALAYYYTGSFDRARTMLEELSNSKSASTAARAGAALAGVLGAQGEAAAARSIIERLLKNSYRDHHVAYSLGAAYAQLGDDAEANRWLRTAADTGFPCLPFYERDPLLEPLRRVPAFPDLLAHVRLRRETALTASHP
jgi:DNA-binding winged helix-turn-helix (wHTH) protein/TolB-like protein